MLREEENCERDDGLGGCLASACGNGVEMRRGRRIIN
jgi:hypothetical protein